MRNLDSQSVQPWTLSSRCARARGERTGQTYAMERLRDACKNDAAAIQLDEDVMQQKAGLALTRTTSELSPCPFLPGILKSQEAATGRKPVDRPCVPTLCCPCNSGQVWNRLLAFPCCPCSFSWRCSIPCCPCKFSKELPDSLLSFGFPVVLAVSRGFAGFSADLVDSGKVCLDSLPPILAVSGRVGSHSLLSLQFLSHSLLSLQILEGFIQILCCPCDFWKSLFGFPVVLAASARISESVCSDSLLPLQFLVGLQGLIPETARTAENPNKTNNVNKNHEKLQGKQTLPEVARTAGNPTKPFQNLQGQRKILTNPRESARTKTSKPTRNCKDSRESEPNPSRNRKDSTESEQTLRDPSRICKDIRESEQTHEKLQGQQGIRANLSRICKDSKESDKPFQNLQGQQGIRANPRHPSHYGIPCISVPCREPRGRDHSSRQKLYPSRYKPCLHQEPGLPKRQGR